MPDTEARDLNNKIHEIIPWARSNPLRDVMEKRERQKKEVLKIASRFSSPLFSDRERINKE